MSGCSLCFNDDLADTLWAIYHGVKTKPKYLNASVTYQDNHIIGFSHDESTKSAIKVLTFIIAPIMGAPVFVYWLISIIFSSEISPYLSKLKKLSILFIKMGAFFLWCVIILGQIKLFFTDIAKSLVGHIFSFWTFTQKLKNLKTFFFLYDPNHIWKNIYNNWQT